MDGDPQGSWPNHDDRWGWGLLVGPRAASEDGAPSKSVLPWMPFFFSGVWRNHDLTRCSLLTFLFSSRIIKGDTIIMLPTTIWCVRKPTKAGHRCESHEQCQINFSCRTVSFTCVTAWRIRSLCEVIVQMKLRASTDLRHWFGSRESPDFK